MINPIKLLKLLEPVVSMTGIRYKSGYKYQLDQTVIFKVSIHPPRDIATSYVTLTRPGWLVITSGYAWDGASGPAWDTKAIMRASLIHDALYQLQRLRLLDLAFRLQADQIFRDTYIFDALSKLPPENWKTKIPNAIRRGVIKSRSVWIYQAVRKFGKNSAAGNPRPVLKAP